MGGSSTPRPIKDGIKVDSGVYLPIPLNKRRGKKPLNKSRCKAKFCVWLCVWHPNASRRPLTTALLLPRRFRLKMISLLVVPVVRGSTGLRSRTNLVMRWFLTLHRSASIKLCDCAAYRGERPRLVVPRCPCQDPVATFFTNLSHYKSFLKSRLPIQTTPSPSALRLSSVGPDFRNIQVSRHPPGHASRF